MDMVQILICIIVGYLCGSFLPAVLIAKRRTGKDIAEIGTGNPGMANVMANIGKTEGTMVLIGDILKVVVSCLLAWLITWDMEIQAVILWTGFATIPGHDFSIWHRFHGGKGVAVTCAWLAFSMPLWGTAACAIGGIITLLTGYLPLGATMIPLLAILPAFLCYGVVPGILAVISAALMVQRNYQGLCRILAGTERRSFRRK